MKTFLQPEIKTIADKLGIHAKNLEGKTILISGASGFLGGYFIGSIQHLNKTEFKKPCKIIAIDNFITGTKKNPFIDAKDKNLVFLKQDVTKQLDVPGKVDYMIAAAGLASPVYYAKYPLETIDAAVAGVRSMLDLARKKKPRSLLYFSSSEIYGNPHPEYIPTKETYHGHVSSVGLRACYDESKRMGETLCTVYNRIYDVPVAIVRPFNVYGPGMKSNDYRVLPNFLMAALQGRTIEIHNNGMQTRTFCYATDAIDGFFRVLLLGKPGEAYNIGSDDDEITMHELAKRTENVFGKKLKIKETKYPEGYPVGDPERRRPDLTKARTHLGYAPSVPLEEGLGKMFIWYRKLLELE